MGFNVSADDLDSSSFFLVYIYIFFSLVLKRGSVMIRFPGVLRRRNLAARL